MKSSEGGGAALKAFGPKVADELEPEGCAIPKVFDFKLLKDAIEHNEGWRLLCEIAVDKL